MTVKDFIFGQKIPAPKLRWLWRSSNNPATHRERKPQETATTSAALRATHRTTHAKIAKAPNDACMNPTPRARRLVSLLLAEKKKEKESDPLAWTAVDLDGTLARYTGWKGATQIGAPIPRMVRRIRRWVGHGKKVKLFTARADDERAVNAIKAWLKDNDLPDLEITNIKDQHMTELWDDRAVAVERNTGKVRESLNAAASPLDALVPAPLPT